MKIFDLKIFKEARFGSDVPTAFQNPGDRDTPYPSNFIPNKGRSRRITQFMNQGGPGETPDMSASGGKFSDNDVPLSDYLENPTSHPYSNSGDPDPLFSSFRDDGDKTQYGDGGYSNQFTGGDSPLSNKDSINRATPGKKNEPYDRKTLTSQMNIARMQSKIRNLSNY